MNIINENILWFIGLVFSFLILWIRIRFSIYQDKIAILREASREFSKTIHNELKDIYPIPAKWPEGTGIDVYLKKKFPVLQSAVNKFAGYLPKKEKREFLNAWRFYRLGKEGRDIDEQYYGQYQGFTITTVINGKIITEVTDGKANLKHNIDTLLSYAKYK